jgi:hypothetical protein
MKHSGLAFKLLGLGRLQNVSGVFSPPTKERLDDCVRRDEMAPSRHFLQGIDQLTMACHEGEHAHKTD